MIYLFEFRTKIVQLRMKTLSILSLPLLIFPSETLCIDLRKIQRFKCTLLVECTFHKRKREKESAMMFKRRVLEAKLLSTSEAPGGFRSSLVSIRRKFIVAISTAHNRERA